MIDWLVSQDPGPWTFGLVAFVSTLIAAAAMSRMYCKYRSREGERRLQEHMERMRLEREREVRRDITEVVRIRNDMLDYMIEREIDRRTREGRDDDAEEGPDARRGESDNAD